MLYNPEWEPKKPDPFSLDGLVAWLEQKLTLGDGTYTYMNNKHCLLCQYFEAMGYENPYVDCRILGFINKDGMPEYKALPRHFDGIARGLNWSCKPDHTFGKALERARLYRDRYALVAA